MALPNDLSAAEAAQLVHAGQTQALSMLLCMCFSPPDGKDTEVALLFEVMSLRFAKNQGAEWWHNAQVEAEVRTSVACMREGFSTFRSKHCGGDDHGALGACGKVKVLATEAAMRRGLRDTGEHGSKVWYCWALQQVGIPLESQLPLNWQLVRLLPTAYYR